MHTNEQGRGRGVSYDLRGDPADRLRMLQLLKERGRRTNAEIRRLSGFSRARVYRLIKQLEQRGQVRIVEKGRGAHIVRA